MPRIRVALTPEDAKAAPREYALLKQLEAGSDGSFYAQVCALAEKVLGLTLFATLLEHTALCILFFLLANKPYCYASTS